MRRRNAAKKRKLNAADKSKSTDTEEDSTFDDEGIISCPQCLLHREYYQNSNFSHEKSHLFQIQRRKSVKEVFGWQKSDFVTGFVTS